MKQKNLTSPKACSALLLGFTALTVAAGALGEALLNPNQLGGTLRFTNSNPQIVQELSERGIGAAYMRADSVNLSPQLNNNMSLYLDGGGEFDYQMTVESATDETMTIEVAAEKPPRKAMNAIVRLPC